MSKAYYNEHDPKSAAWLRELIKQGHIAPGDVDERSIEDVLPSELAGYTQCHFFAGIGVWSYALRQAGWPDDRPVWTGSCPCQPFSSAGKRGGTSDERHLWPAFYWLISQCKPDAVFGEQVASKDGLAWLDTVQSDMEAAGYAIGAVDLCAAGVGAPHIRQRLYFVAESLSQQEQSTTAGRLHAESGERGAANFVADSQSVRGRERQPDIGRRINGSSEGQGAIFERYCAINQLADAQHAERRPEHEKYGQAYRRDGLGRGGNAGILGNTEGGRRQPISNVSGSSGTGNEPPEQRDESGIAKSVSELGNAHDAGSQGYRRLVQLDDSTGRTGAKRHAPTAGFWSNAEWIYCRDGKWRATEPGISPMVNGATARVGRLRGYGNAIVAPVAEAFIRAYLDR